MLKAVFLVLGRKMLVKRTRFVGASFFCFLVVFGVIYYYSPNSSKDLFFANEPARTIKMPLVEHQGNKEPDGIHLTKLSDTSSTYRTGVNLRSENHTNQKAVNWPNDQDTKVAVMKKVVSQPGIYMMPSGTAECLTSALQPVLGHFNIQISSLMEKLPYDNVNGGVWKQGFQLTYSMDNFVEEPLQVIIVPHSHNDPGWIKTFEEYYMRQTKNILTTVTNSLALDPRKKFIWAEISFLDLWWNEQNQMMRDKFKMLVSNGQLEIVTGGWVMNDEANTHYYAMLDQLIEGHTWLQKHLPGVVPRASWACDPFGYSPTMTYLLRHTGVESMFIQRAHYSLKKHLAKQKQLEFLWVQEWDRDYHTGLWCHVMPFYIYDIPHTCGPDPKICCQFDFQRLPGSKISCPWKVRPQPITERNVRERAETLADQYRKKSLLFKAKVVLIPLGDDFRWETPKEINAQFDNYYKLIDYMNSHSDMKINVKFGTLSDYFNAVKTSVARSSSSKAAMDTFPTLAGDFFTYSDRDDHYWSGYFTSRPFHKHMDRVLESALRTAEILYSLTVAKGLPLPSAVNAPQLLTDARRSLALFQHHDGITGTSKDIVVNDFAKKMLVAIKNSQEVTQRSLKALLSSEYSEIKDLPHMWFTPEETYPTIKTLPSIAVIDIKSRDHNVVTFVNSLAHERTMLVSVLVNSPDLMVTDAFKVILFCQVSPVLDGFQLATDRYQVVFLASLPAMGVAHYLLTATPPGLPAEGHVVKANVQYINHNFQTSSVFNTEQYQNNDVILSTLYNVTAKFSGQTGLLRSVSVGSSQVEVDIDFVSYGSRNGKDRSGAYLFLPPGEASSIVLANGKPRVIIVIGPLVQEVTTFLPRVKHSVVLSSSPGLDGLSLSLHNTVDIGTSSTNKEIAMRMKSSLANKDATFYTDLNGFQLTRRKTFSKIPMQGNFYPMPSTAVLQDSNHRLTLHSRQPLGVASLKQGWLEVILDRKLLQDDSRGLGQGVKDSVVTFEPFKLLIERRLKDRMDAAALIYPSLLSQYTQDSLLHPPSAFLSLHSSPSALPPPPPPPLSFLQAPLPCDIFLVNLRSLFHTKMAESALILHRRGFDCGFDMSSLQCEVRNGEIRLGNIFRDVTISEATETSLSLFHDVNQLELKRGLSSHLDIMQLQTYRLAW